jgi:uncharacterized protein YggU (UPF0235/DUF167 family)
MKIIVKVIPRAKQNKALHMPDGSYKIWITASPVDGKANKALVDFMAGVLDKPKSRISIVKGASGQVKTLEVE